METVAATSTVVTVQAEVKVYEASETSFDPSHPSQSKSKTVLDVPLGRKTLASIARDGELKRQSAANADILSKAREMKMKIWQLEKLHRVMNTMIASPTESQAQSGYVTRAMTNLNGARGDKDVDLSRMIQNEQLNGPLDRDSSSVLEVIRFKGPHIYIRDMDEKTKPIMMREYPKVSREETGEWPQFRSVSAGKCPFVEEVKTEKQKIKDEEESTQPGAPLVPKTRAVSAKERSRVYNQTCQPDECGSRRQRKPLGESRHGGNTAMPLQGKPKEQLICGPPPTIPPKEKSPLKGVKALSALANRRLVGEEPAASGLQPSNITSAIRSQMISSTSAAPGIKAGTSREYQGLQRKLLERNGPVSLTRARAAQGTVDPAANVKPETSTATTRHKAAREPEKLIHVEEESTQSEADEDIWRSNAVVREGKRYPKGLEKREPKPGYCENCRDKYDDFDEVSCMQSMRKDIMINTALAYCRKEAPEICAYGN